MHAVREGSGRPLLLVHGLGSSHRNWDPIVPSLSAQREVIAVDLPGFGQTPPLPGEVSIASLTDSVEEFIAAEGLENADLVGSSMGARMVVELARRGHAGTVVALNPGGFWDDRQVKIFGTTIKASVGLVRRIQPALPTLTGNPIGRTVLLAQFSAHPWKLPQSLVLNELRGFDDSPGLDEALHALVHGPRQLGAAAGSLRGRLVIGWGRQDKVTVPSQAERALRLFPDATLHWFSDCGHFPHWDQPEETAALILDACNSTTTGAKERAMSEDRNIATQERFGAAVNSGRLDEFDDLVAADCVDHDPAPGQGPGPQGYRDMFTEMRTAFPDLHVEVEHLIARDDTVAFAYTITGTHQGPLMGHEATGKSFTIRGAQIGRFTDGKMVERWGSSDQLGMLTQLGLT